MIDTTKALYDWARRNRAIVGALGCYRGQVAIFEERAPDDHEIIEPALIIDVPRRNDRSDTSSCVIRDITVTMRVYALTVSPLGDVGSSKLHRAAEMLATELHNAVISLPNGMTMGCKVSGPVNAPTESPSLGGRLITTRWLIQET